MLRSTHTAYKSASETQLPPGWTEHKAPTGHTYYYNTETKQSTYTRPTIEPDVPLQIDYNATQPDSATSAVLSYQQYASGASPANGPNAIAITGHFNGGRSYQNRPPRRDNDRPRSKAKIPNCEPWLLVKTKLGRRFVHNTNTKESFWKFPQDVMLAVIEMDRLEWEAKKTTTTTTGTENTTEPEKTNGENADSSGAPRPSTEAPGQGAEDSDSYEEVEVTDSEGEGPDLTAKKRQRTSSPSTANQQPLGPTEFTEEDIAYQLAQMGEEYSLDPEDYDYPSASEGNGDAIDPNQQAQPDALTEDESVLLFKSLLTSLSPPITPYWTFDRVLDSTPITSDNRYLSLPTTQKRRDVFSDWAREHLHQAHSTTPSAKSDRRSTYLDFLSDHVAQVSKLYWAEFKRKHRKDPAMTAREPNDKEREKLYRDFAARLKTPELERRRELGRLCKEISAEEWREGLGAGMEDGNGEEGRVPTKLETDVRYWVVPEKERRGVVEAHVSSLGFGF